MNKVFASLAVAMLLAGCKVAQHDISYNELMVFQDQTASNEVIVNDSNAVYNEIRPEIKRLTYNKARTYISSTRANAIYKCVLNECEYESMSGFSNCLNGKMLDKLRDVADEDRYQRVLDFFAKFNPIVANGKIDMIYVIVDNKYKIVLVDKHGNHYIEFVK